jgi:site-specific DNA-methyltransferase (adenine-specific)
MTTYHKVITGDSRKMSIIPDETIHMVVTSPPYWQLKDYGSENQIGYHETYEQYINNLNLVWNECYRVLHPGCRLCVNIGDQFARAVYYGRYKVIPIRTEIIKFCESIGFDYMGAIIWQKVTTTNTSGGGVQMGSFPYPRNGILKIDYEFILVFKKLGDAPKPSSEQKELSKMTNQEWNTFFAGHWNFAGARQDNHIAMFPEELPRRLIKMFTFVNDIVLDPFLGSGTTSLAAKNLYRNSVGYEINKDFVPVIRDKLNANQTDISGTTYDFLSDLSPNDFDAEIQKLPYIFTDPQKFDKKIDPKKLRFGSKIDKNTEGREEYFSVKKVVSPDKVILDNNLTVRLIGVQESPTANGQAIEYLVNKTQGQKVFIKHDSDIYDESNQMLCYLYLKNKTFLNAHLIKNGLAIADRNRSYRLREKFIKLEEEANA